MSAYAAYLVAVVALVDWIGFWRPMVDSLRDTHREDLVAPRYVDMATMRRLGSLRADRMSSFPRFDRQKAEGTLRLCAYGDSFTYGDEVADGHDYPAFLQRSFEERGARNVEVINFGNSWYGFHQTFIVWSEIGRAFDCDVVLLGPDCFQPDRDTTFNHTGLAYPYYLHARFVLDEHAERGRVRLVDVLGDTPEERFDAYLRFVPPLRYLRYDRNPPAALRALLRQGRTVANPFYYDRRSAETEAYETYEELLVNMGRAGAPVVLVHSRADVVAVAERAAARGRDVDLAAVWLPRLERFPYLAAGGHYSAFGNQWLASQYFALLTGGGEVAVVDFADASTSQRSPPSDEQGAEPLSAYRRIDVRIDGRPVGVFSVASSDPSRRRGGADDLYQSEVAALVAVRAPGTPLVDAAWVPLRRTLRPGEVLEVRVGGDGEARTVASIPVRALAAGVNLAVVDLDGVVFDGDLKLVRSASIADTSAAVSSGLPPGPPADVLADVPEGTPVSLTVGGELLATGRLQNAAVRLTAQVADLRTLRAVAGDYAELGPIGRGGELMLHLEHAAEVAQDVPIARWWVHGQAAARFAGDRSRVGIVDGQAAVAPRAEPASGRRP